MHTICIVNAFVFNYKLYLVFRLKYGFKTEELRKEETTGSQAIQAHVVRHIVKKRKTYPS